VIMKSFYFTHLTGMCVKIVEIPVLESQHPFAFQINARLQLFISKIQKQKNPNFSYSFREYLRNSMKWSEYSRVYEVNTLEKNA
jgi:hypothetical protein